MVAPRLSFALFGQCSVSTMKQDPDHDRKYGKVGVGGRVQSVNTSETPKVSITLLSHPSNMQENSRKAAETARKLKASSRKC